MVRVNQRFNSVNNYRVEICFQNGPTRRFEFKAHIILLFLRLIKYLIVHIDVRAYL